MSSKSYLNTIFETCDITGSQIKLNYKGHTSIKTFFGGIMSLIIMLFTLFCISYFGIDLIQKQKPISRFYKEFVNESIVNFTDFPVMMIITNPSGLPVPNLERILYIDAVYYILGYNAEEKVQKSNRYNLFVEPCNESHYSKYKDLIDKSNVPLKYAYCINPHKIDFLNGTISNDEYLYSLNEYGNVPSRFSIARVRSCKNTTTNGNNCAPDYEIDAFLSGGSFFSAFYVDNYVNLDFYEEPNVSFVTNYVQAITKGMTKANHLKVKNTNIYTDSGIILEDISQQQFHQVDNIANDIISSTEYLLALYIDTTKMTDNYFRKYVKLQDLIANIGGLIKFLFTISSIILSFYTERYKLIDISNSVFQVQKAPMNNEGSNINLVGLESRVATPVSLDKAFNRSPQIERKGCRDMDANIGDYIKAQFKCRSKYSKSHYNSLRNFIQNSLEVKEIIKCVLRAEKLADGVVNLDDSRQQNKTLLFMDDKMFIKDVKGVKEKITTSTKYHLTSRKMVIGKD
jgi:hypothetical protein